jgi:hypothetical protein
MKGSFLIILILCLSIVSTAQPALEWAKSMGGTGYDDGFKMVRDVQGNIYSTGRFSGTADFDPGVGVNNLVSVDNFDIFCEPGLGQLAITANWR